MNIVKKIINKSTGYWLHKLNNLPVGADLFVDIHHKIKRQPLEVIFDIGANIGQSRTYFRFHAPNAKIYSFEPVQATFAQLQKTAGADTNCVLEHMALGDEQGEKKIRLFDGDMTVLNSLRDDSMNPAANAREEIISIDTLDHYCAVHGIVTIDLLKIDTEGFEINVLKGAEQMMQQGKIAFIYCETGFQSSNQRNTYFPVLTEFLAERDYYFFGLYNTDYHDWKRGNHLSNALYIHQSVFPA